MKIAHLADVHIRGLQYLDEIEYTFEALYESLEENEVDLIVIAGDIYHSKLTITAEYVEAARKFFNRLVDIAEVVVIPGNHDLALSNPDRLDALTPVINSVEGKYWLHYFKNSEDGEPLLLKEKLIRLYHFSILDPKEKWPKKEDLDPSSINIALYHGSINNCIVDNGWVSRGNRDDITIFEGFDFALLGDIHKFQFMDPERRIAYPGSLRQNNYGEDQEKGYLLWEIENRDDFDVQRIILPQKRYFYTISIETAEDKLDGLNIEKDCRIQVKSSKRFTLAEEVKIRSTIKQLYKPHNDVPIIYKEDAVQFQDIAVGNTNISNESIRTPDAQKQLIEDYLKNKQVDEDTIKKVVEIDKRYNSYLSQDVLRNILWRPKKLSWDNLFAYGPDNEINFDRLKGLVGIFGKNGIGKSSCIDTILLGLYNNIFREGANRSSEYINTNANEGKLSLTVECDDHVYSIDRSITKNINKKGEEKVASIVEFSRKKGANEEKLNGETTPDTNQNIRHIFGNMEDFVITSLCPQFGITEFIDAGATNRKKILAKFFDLGVFEEKYKLADKDFYIVSRRAKEVSNKDFDAELNDLIPKSDFLQVERFKNELYIGSYEKKIKALEEEIIKKKTLLEGSVNVGELTQKYNKAVLEMKTALENVEEIRMHIETEEEYLAKCRANEKVMRDGRTIEKSNEILAEIQAKSKEIREITKSIQQHQQKIELLDKIPNVPACGGCVFAKDAYEAKDNLVKLRIRQNELGEEETTAVWMTIANMYNTLQREKPKLKPAEKFLKAVTEKVELLKQQVDAATSTKEQHGELEKLIEEKNDLEVELKKARNLDREYSTECGIYRNKIDTLKQQQIDAQKIMEEFNIYSFYLDAMGKDGISFQIMSQRLPFIQSEVNRILSYIVDFKIEIKDSIEEKSIRLYMVDKRGKRSVELCSGAEKTIICLILRTVLWKMSSLPKTPMLILDECFGFLDDEKHDGVLKMLEHLKTQFEYILLITHNEALKAVVDYTIYVEQDEQEKSKMVVKNG